MSKPLPERSFLRRIFQGADSRGFTLVEVILSVVILMVGVIAVQRTLIGSLSALSMIENWDQAEGLLQGKIWENKRVAIEKPKSLKPTKQHGTVLGKNRTYQYDLVIRSINKDESLLEADMKISWENMGIRRSLPRVFYLRVPDAKNADKISRI